MLIELLDKGSIELLDVMPSSSSCDMAVVEAARVSYKGHTKGEEKDKKLLHFLLRHHHTSPLEMVEFKIRVVAPVVTWWQWVRHRTWNFNFESGRYVQYDDDKVYTPSPEQWRGQAKHNKQMSDGFLKPEAGELLTENMTFMYEMGQKFYKDALQMGVAREQARLFLPAFGVYYGAIAKCDANNLIRFLRLRLPDEAQYEIRVYARAIYDHILKPYMPWTCEFLEREEGMPWLEKEWTAGEVARDTLKVVEESLTR